jgi:hypothetical protein
MSTIRETIETTYAAAAFAERNLSREANLLLKGESSRPDARVGSGKKAEKRPRPVIQVK